MRSLNFSPRVREWLAFISILLIGAFMRFYQLEYKSLWVDEIGQVVAAQGGVTEAVRGAAQHVAAPPLDYLVSWLMLQVGSNEFILRFAPAAWSILSLAVLYALTKRLAHSKRIALLAAYLLTLAPFVIRYAQEVRFYSLSLFLTLLCVYTFLRAWQQPTTLRWLWFTLAAVPAVYAHYYIAFVFAALVVWSVLHRTALTRAHLTGLAFSLGIVVLAALPWLVYAGRGEPTTYNFSFPSPADVLSDPVLGVNTDPDWRAAQNVLGVVVLPALALLGLLSLWRTHRAAAVLFALVIFVGTVGVLAADALLSYFYTPRQLLFLVPFYLVLVAAGLVAVWRFVSGSQRLLPVALSGALIIGITLFFLVSLRGYYDWVKDDWRSAARLLQNANAASIRVYPSTLGTYLTYYQPGLSNALRFEGAEPFWIVTQDFQRPTGLQGLNMVHLNASPALDVIYMGRASEQELWQQVAALDLPPQVVAFSDILERVQAFDPVLAQTIATRARLSARTANPPLLDSQSRRLERKLRAFP